MCYGDCLQIALQIAREFEQIILTNIPVKVIRKPTAFSDRLCGNRT